MNTDLQKKFKAAEIEAMKRVQACANGGAIDCESSMCDCPVRRKITATTLSCVVTPEYKIELVCHYGALKFAVSHNVTL